MYTGIVAGMWPCGTIIFLDELFRAESTAQVYGCLHTFFYTNPLSTKDISMKDSALLKYVSEFLCTVQSFCAMMVLVI